MATRDPGTATPPDATSAPSTPSKPSSEPTVDPPKTTTDSKSSEATTPTSVAPITTSDKPTTTATMSTAEPSIATTGESPVATTTTNPPVTTTDPPVTTPPTTTTTTTEPPVTEPPVTATTTDHITTTDPSVTTTTTTKDPLVTTTTTTEVSPVKTTTTTEDLPARTTTTTTPPYTTRYVTTISIVTVTTVVPETTIISGRGTTIYITRSTTSPMPTIIQDPTQEPAATQIDSSAKGGLQTWQITLIVVATLVIMGAVGAAVLVGKIKRERKKRDTMLFLDKPESVLGSEMGESGGGRSNRTLVVGGQHNHYHSGQNGGGSGWRERLSAWRPWDSHGSYHQQQQHPGGLEYNQGTGQGGGGGLWLMDESDPNYDRSAAVAGVDAAMRPVSYDTNVRLSGVGDTFVGEEDPHHYGNYPYTAQAQGRYYDQEEAPATASAMVAAPRGAAGTLNPLDDLAHPSVQRGPSSVTTAATAMTSGSQQRHLQQQSSRGSLSGRISPSVGQLERLSTEEGSDYVDSHGLHRQSQDWTLSSVTSAGAGIGVSTGTGAIEDRTSIRVDPDQLESHALFELVRKAPQAILGTSPPKAQESARVESPTLPSAPLPPPSSTTATDTETVEMIADGDSENNDAVSESHPTTITLLPVESTPVLKHASLDSEQQQ
ncbi:hypothetical protein EC957_011969 [Mortierella hygrophila]|uniref:Uncharacterized protein n=1 Tax=Mortierella hygrophila TaxID=979708 RepID=A0A9P6FGT7_9FUNG|nr:hypothetical protein EC957_011969 [Mortierella hygrophila]